MHLCFECDELSGIHGEKSMVIYCSLFDGLRSALLSLGGGFELLA